MLDRNAGIESYSLRTKTLFSMLTSEIKQELRRIEEESAKAIRDLYNSGGKLKQDGTDRRGTFINGAGEYTLWRAADKDFPLSSGTEAVYFATTYKQAKDYEHRGIEAKKGYESNKETHAYKVKIENPLIIERAGYHDLGTAMERWKVLFPDEPFPRQTDNYAWWRRMDRKCERRAKELGYDAIVTSCEDFREVAVLGKKLKKDKAIQMDSKSIFDGIITLIQ